MNQKYTLVISSIAIIIAVGGIVYQHMSSLPEQPQPDQSVPVQSTQNTSETLSAILPVRDDVGTTWKIFPASIQPFSIKDITEINRTAFPSAEELAQLKSSIESAEGYEEGVTQIFWKNLEGQDFLIDIWAFKFDSSDTAWIQYNKTIARVYEEGGYEEYDTKRIGLPCYGTMTSKLKGESYDHMNLYCAKDDVFYRIYAANAPRLTDMDKDVVAGFGKIISDKILSPLSVITDKITYTDVDTIVISGTVKNPKGLPLTMRILDPNHNLVQIAQVDVSQDGRYTVTIKPTGVMWNTQGTFTVEVEYGLNMRAATTFLFKPSLSQMPQPPDAGSTGVVRFENAAGGGGVTQNRVFKQLPSALPADRWIAEFEYEFTSSGMVNHYIFALSPTSEDLEDISESIIVRHGTGVNQLHLVGYGELSANIPISPNTKYYLRLERTSAHMEFGVFSDPERALHVVGSPVTSVIEPSDLDDLNFIQHSTSRNSGPGRILTAQLDNTVIIDPEKSGRQIIFMDDYSSDAGWTQIGTSVTVNKLYTSNPQPPNIGGYLESGASGIKYDITGGKVKGITVDTPSHAVLVSVDAVEDGVLTVTIPRSIVDAKIGNQDDSFFVLMDGEETSYKEHSTTGDRTLVIPFGKGTEEIEILGTSLT